MKFDLKFGVISLTHVLTALVLAGCGGENESSSSNEAAADANATTSAEPNVGTEEMRQVSGVGLQPDITWQFLATEHAAFNVPANSYLLYGFGSKWVSKSVSGVGTCSNEFFGIDPRPQMWKACYIAVASPAPAPAPAPTTGVNISSFGAVCDGTTNNSAAIEAAIASAKSRKVAVIIPEGVCAYGDIIRLDGVKLIGSGDRSVLYALNWARESIFVYGDGVEIRRLKLSGVKAPSRQADWESTRISLFGATNFVIDSITIDGSAAAGIQTAKHTSRGRITNNTIKDTLSDGIHMTDNASYITVENNRIENTGDDGIAVVSYRSDGGLVNNITARNNVVRNNKWGRQMSVVGGADVLYENNLLENNLAQRACLYIAQENSYDTYGARNVLMQFNTLRNCGGPASGHGGVMMFSDGAEANTNITLTRNDLYQSGQIGIRVISNWNTAVTLDSNRVQGANPATEISSPSVIFTPYTSGAVGYTAPR